MEKRGPGSQEQSPVAEKIEMEASKERFHVVVLARGSCTKSQLFLVKAEEEFLLVHTR